MTGEHRWLKWLALAAALTACQSADYPRTPEGYYLHHCSRCHEPDGSSVTASELADSRVDLRDPVFQRLVSDAEIARIIVHGQGRMQGLDLQSAVIDSIVIHVRSFGPGAIEGEARSDRSP